MAWYNNPGDLWGDIKSIASGHNPMNKPAPVQAPVPGMPGTTGGLPPGATTVPGSSSGQTNGPPTTGTTSTSSFGLDSLGDLLGGIDWGKLGLIGLGGLEGANAIQLGKKSTDLANQALGSVQDNWNFREPLRLAGMQGMLNPQTNDISSITAHGGPYSAGLPAVHRNVMAVPTAPRPTGTTPVPVPGANLPPGASTTPTNSMTEAEYQEWRKTHPLATNSPTSGVSTTVNFGGHQFTPTEWAQYLKDHPDAQSPH